MIKKNIKSGDGKLNFFLKIAKKARVKTRMKAIKFVLIPKPRSSKKPLNPNKIASIKLDKIIKFFMVFISAQLFIFIS
jgi:hypothetical protein